ncbi:glycosyltransferase family 2 protein [Candidatus Cetobacterium colombiensis]|uniref:Glycosyltransferase family 2 protein n=1 Tax=Candidatus Cetobacterium colombiensis TaxID=3073100 RepID=A0ABU4W8F8_9FUSO|nr:glycosyltransferase family 2 protein [Candidatus Cetobacterium colombiensis]MDX8334896.1 glycosyltransferase family 2 protein [Candidatus Cetobacterium colombiensis]
MKSKSCGLVIWYNPGIGEVKNLKTYYDELEKIFIVDNSDINNSKLIENLEKIEYIPNYKNLGIATALNQGCKKAIENGYQWILTMDQDSKFDNNFNSFLKEANRIVKKDNSIVIVGPKIQENQKSGYMERIITSGNLLNLKAYLSVNGFRDDFFIDEVDFDICYRLRKKGYKIYCLENIILKHKLGNPKSLSILGKTITSMNHGHIRKYYIIRNRLHMSKLYPECRLSYIKDCILDTIKILLLEKDKIKKLIYSLKGYIDYKRNKFGKL